MPHRGNQRERRAIMPHLPKLTAGPPLYQRRSRIMSKTASTKVLFLLPWAMLRSSHGLPIRSCTITSRSRCRPTTRASSLIAPQSPELLGSSGASDLHFAGPHRFDQTRSIGCPEDVPGNKQPGRPKGAKPRSIHSATREAAQQSPSNCRPEARDKELPTGTRRKRMSKPCQSSRSAKGSRLSSRGHKTMNG